MRTESLVSSQSGRSVDADAWFTLSVSVNATMTLAILFLLKTMELLQNELQPWSGVIPLFSMRTELLASL